MAETLLPDNATELESALAITTARLDALPVDIRRVVSAATAPADFLPWLAWAFSVDVEWDLAVTDAQKREVIARSVAVHRRKGTVAAVQDAIDSLGFTVQLQEWFNQIPMGEPFTYRLIVTADQRGYTKEDLKKLIRVVNASKNLRSHQTEVAPSITSTATAVAQVVVLSGYETTVAYGPYYSDLEVAWGLILDAAIYGEERTVAAIDELKRYMTEVMPAANFWN